MQRKPDIYEKQLIGHIEKTLPSDITHQIMHKLLDMGAIDSGRCKIMVIRDSVDRLVAQGNGKVDSMYITAEEFCCSYEYVRKCVYQHRDINFGA